MKRKERSSSRSIDGNRKYKKTNSSISCESKETSKNDESDIQRRLEIAITTNEIIAKLLELELNKKGNSNHSLQLWCYRFLK